MKLEMLLLSNFEVSEKIGKAVIEEGNLLLFYIFANVPFTTRKIERDYLIISNKVGIHELPHELPNDFRLRILRN